MKTLITKSDGTPTKSKVHALQFLEKNGIPKELLIEENGQFFYAGVNEGINEGGNSPHPLTPSLKGRGNGFDSPRPLTPSLKGRGNEFDSPRPNPLTTGEEERLEPQDDNEIPKQVQNDNKNVEVVIADEKPIAVDVAESIFKPVVWDTPIYDKNNNKTKLVVIGTDVMATINSKHPAGQNRNVSAFELNIGNENFIMSLNLISRLFKVTEG